MDMLSSFLLCCAMLGADAASPATVIVVVGAPGTPEYGEQFRQWAGRWEEAAKRGGASCLVLGTDDSSESSDRDRLQKQLAETAAATPSALWLVLIGHGTYDGKTARFNLRGPDVSSRELRDWLQPLSCPLAVVNCASSSGPFLNDLSGPDRVIVVAAKSGHEHNFSRFGDYLSAAIADPAADLDKDEQTSLLEAYLLASSRVAEFYSGEGRLATEHALLDDNGDRAGTPADWFRGTRAVKSSKGNAEIDGARAARWHLVRGSSEERLSPAARNRRDELENDLAEVRQSKGQISEAEYLDRLEPLLLEISRLYEGEATESAPRSEP
jgi:hypothetical protein